MICCVSRAKMHIWSRKIDESWGFGVFFLVFSFSQFSMIFRWFDYQFQFPGWISCPGVVSDRPGIEFSLKMENFIKDVTGRNKNYQKYQLWAPDEFIIPPSSRALALHALIISLKPSGKIVKLQNELANSSDTVKFMSKLFKLSFNFDLKTSCALPPYYSLELDPISSTSHSNLLNPKPGHLKLSYPTNHIFSRSNAFM